MNIWTFTRHEALNTVMILRLSPLLMSNVLSMSYQAPIWVERLICQQCKNVSFLNPVKHLFLLWPHIWPQLSLQAILQPSARMYSCYNILTLQSSQSQVRKPKDTQLKPNESLWFSPPISWPRLLQTTFSRNQLCSFFAPALSPCCT